MLAPWRSYSRQIEAHLAAAAAAAVAISHHLAEDDRLRTLLGSRASAAAADRAAADIEDEESEEEEAEEEEAEEDDGEAPKTPDEIAGRGVKRCRDEVTDLAAHLLEALRKTKGSKGLSIATLAELCAQEVPLVREAVDMLVHDGDAEPTDIQRGHKDDETVRAV